VSVLCGGQARTAYLDLDNTVVNNFVGFSLTKILIKCLNNTQYSMPQQAIAV
jgi:hypothetical protein